MRKEKSGNRYYSFNEVAQEVFKMKPYENKMRNLEKKESFISKFEANHLCKDCKKPLSFIGGNVLACTNPDCSSNGFVLLDEKSKGFANFIYEGKGAYGTV